MKKYVYLLFFTIFLVILYSYSETYAPSSLCNLSKNFRVSGQVVSIIKMEDGYKIKVCNLDCCKTLYIDEFIMPGEHVVLCGHENRKVKRC